MAGDSRRRRDVLAAIAAPAVPALLGTAGAQAAARTAKIKLSCNLYSFNGPLRSGEMTLEQAIDFCAELGFEAVDPTGYYFPGYPAPPADDYVYGVKRRASSHARGAEGLVKARTVDFEKLSSDLRITDSLRPSGLHPSARRRSQTTLWRHGQAPAAQRRSRRAGASMPRRSSPRSPN